MKFVHVTLVLLEIAGAVWSEDWHSLREVTTDCPERCDATSSPGSYAVHGGAAQRLNRRLRPQQKYFAGSDCNDPRANASVVPWISPQENPINDSFIAVYSDPLLPHLLGATDAAKLCAEEDGVQQCLCELSGHRTLGVFGTLAATFPSSQSLVQLQLAMQRRCPSGVPNVYGATLVVLLLLLAVLVGEAFWSWRTSEEPEEKDLGQDEVIRRRPALQIFRSGFSWFAGFVMSLATLQTGALMVVQKSSDVEAAVWLVAALPALLTLAAALFFIFALAKQQLFHGHLLHGSLLTDLPQSIYLALMVFVMLVLYGMLVMFLLASNPAKMLLAITSLAGPFWALLKAVNSSKETDSLLRFVEMDLAKMSQSETPKVKLIAWGCMLRAGRRGGIELDHEEEVADDETQVRLGDLRWFRHHFWSLTGSPSAYLLIPAFAAMIAMSWGISASHLMIYSCSSGELTDLRLASSDALHYAPWQEKYDVTLDVSFRQVALQAMSKVSTTRTISFWQPGTAEVRNFSMADESSGAIWDFKLSNHRVPRVGKVGVAGLRPALPMTFYEVRFSPLVTLPLLLKITAGKFHRSIAWSTLPGSILSVPEGTNDLHIEVILGDFVLGIPQDVHAIAPEGVSLWTAFEVMANASEKACATECQRKLNCFTHYVGKGGCFFAMGDHKVLENGAFSSLPPSTDRKLHGTLSGCQGKEAETQSKMTAYAQKDSIQFGEVSPDWRSTAVSLQFALRVEVSEQAFDAESTNIRFQQGVPVPIDAIGLLLGEVEGTTTVLSSTTKVDRSGKIKVKIMKYDPRTLKGLRLLLLPILPDRDFNISRGSIPSANETDLQYIRKSPKCAESGFVRSRYEVCGAFGRLKDKPFAVQLSVWSGKPEERLIFQVQPKEGGDWTISHHQAVAITFDGVDSPAAWAAFDAGCKVLQDAEKAVASSADALCHLLLRQNCSSEVCKLIDQQGLGGERRYGYQGFMHPPPLLGPDASQTALICQAKMCKKKYQWEFSDSMLRSKDHSTELQLGSVLERARTPDGLLLLQELHKNLKEKSLEMNEYYSPFEKHVVRNVWELSWTPASLITVVAKLREYRNKLSNMPALLLQEWVASTAPLPETENATEVAMMQAAFDPVEELYIEATDLTQLSRASMALEMGRKVTRLVVECARCPPGSVDFPKWPRTTQLKELQIHGFELPALPENACENLTQLVYLNLGKCHMEALPEKIFDNLTHLQILGLRENRLKDLPDKIFDHLSELRRLYLTGNPLLKEPSKCKELNEKGAICLI